MVYVSWSRPAPSTTWFNKTFCTPPSILSFPESSFPGSEVKNGSWWVTLTLLTWRCFRVQPGFLLRTTCAHAHTHTVTSIQAHTWKFKSILLKIIIRNKWIKDRVFNLSLCPPPSLLPPPPPSLFSSISSFPSFYFISVLHFPWRGFWSSAVISLIKRGRGENETLENKKE